MPYFRRRVPEEVIEALQLKTEMAIPYYPTSGLKQSSYSGWPAGSWLVVTTKGGVEIKRELMYDSSFVATYEEVK